MSKPHRWAKEIKAWADGAEIEVYYESQQDWCPAPKNPSWNDEYEYRIKPQPKEPKYLYVFSNLDAEGFWLSDINYEENCHEYVGKIKLEGEDGQ